MDNIIALNTNKTHILVKKNNVSTGTRLPDVGLQIVGKNLGKYILNDKTYQIILINEHPIGYDMIPVSDFSEFELPFVCESNLKIKYLKKLSNIILIIMIMIIVIYLINHIETNYEFTFNKKNKNIL